MTSVPPDSKTLAASLCSFHPIANIFPLIEGTEFDLLAADIHERGLNAPVVMFKGQILDGRNRYRVCLQEKIEPRFEEYTGNDPIGFVISRNLRRRHLTTGQRAQIGAKLATMRQGERTDLGPSANLPKVDQATAAKILKVSERSVRSAVTVQKSGTAELQRVVEQGDIAVSKAAKIARKPAVQQADAIDIHRQSRRIQRPDRGFDGEKGRTDKDAAEIAAAISNIVVILADHLPEEAQRSLIDNFRAAGPTALIGEIEELWRKLRPELFKTGEDDSHSIKTDRGAGKTEVK
jgi:hypothetical protein